MTQRFIRIPRHLHLTERDSRTIEAVFEARYLTNRMVQRLFYTATTASACRQRLRYLFDAGYLRKRRAYPNEPDIYFLGLKGRRYIASLEAYSPTDVDKIAGVPGEGQAPMLMMQHELSVSSLYVDAVLTCRRYGWHLNWQNARMLELAQLGMQPDAYLRIDGPTRSQEAFIEFTAVLPGRGELERKLQRYARFWETHRGVVVLWLVTTAGHVERLKSAVRNFVYRDWFLLGLAGQAAEFLTAPIWWHAERGDRVRFISLPDRSSAPGSSPATAA